MDFSAIGAWLADVVLRALAIGAGIGFLVFVHELGHFVMAKRNGVRVDLFSLGFGPVICSWRKGMGLRAGSTLPEYEELQRRHQETLKAEREGIQREEAHALGEKLRALGQTEYRVSWIPLGGFVKMAGEPLGEERKGTPDELSSKTPGQRFQIFVAGTTMNFLVAFPICVASYLVGKTVNAPVLGELPRPESAEWDAGLTVGDRILSVGGVPVPDLVSYGQEVLRAPHGRPLAVEIERAEGDAARRLTLELNPGGSDRLGALPTSNVIERIEPGSPAERAGLLHDDVILALDGRRVWSASEIQRIVSRSGGRELRMAAYRPSTGKTLSLTVTPTVAALSRVQPPDALNPYEIVGEPVVGAVHPLSRARQKLEAGDRMVRVNGRPVASDRDVREVVERSAALPLHVEVLRGGERVACAVSPRVGATGLGTLDIVLGVQGVCVLGEVPAGTPLAAAGAREGDRVESIGGVAPSSAAWARRWVEASAEKKTLPLALSRDGAPRPSFDLAVTRDENDKGKADVSFVQAYPRLIEVSPAWPLARAGARAGDRVLRVDADGDGKLDICHHLNDLQRAASNGTPFPVEIERDGKVVKLSVTPAPLDVAQIQVALMPQTVFRRYALGTALATGTAEVLDMVKMTAQILVKMFRREEKLTGLAGPIGIINISYSMTHQGAGNFLWLLAFISVSLAVFNLLPIPILDGGHILFLLIEKIKGSPVSEKALIRAQYVGLAFLFSLLIFVTTNDIFRLRGR